jgi:1-phosphofructokinase
MSIITVTLNPAIDQTVAIPGFAAGKVNRVARSQRHAGGKGVNVASMLADLGVLATVTGFLGDANPGLFEELFSRRGITDAFIRVPGETRTGIKIIDENTRETTDINFAGLTPGTKASEELVERIGRLASPDDWFVLSGSVPAGVHPAIYAQLVALIHSKGGKLVLDTSGQSFVHALKMGPDVVKPNLVELSEILGEELGTPEAVVEAARGKLLSRGVSLAVVSMGGDGAVFVTREKALLATPPRVTVQSTVGAGDAMVAGLVFAQHAGLPLEKAARLATALGTYAVTRVGSGLESPGAHERYLNDVKLQSIE